MQSQISNFEYLLALNSAAGRSFRDLSRYPIFPWILADYKSDTLDLTAPSTFRDLSKPIGALTKTRLQNFIKRRDGMESPTFLYGTHYSAPGYCLFYLVRSMPEHMLCLQNGKYDAPDRLFHSMAKCYASVCTNPADVKECIPQFYCPKSGIDMLMNSHGLQLGVTQTGAIVNDVELPPWCKGPADFINKQCAALECSHVSQSLPQWIDLLFGCTARGTAAVEASNVFHPTSYLTPHDYNAMTSPETQANAELHAREFGICPNVLFTKPHPHKLLYATTTTTILDIIHDCIVTFTNEPTTTTTTTITTDEEDTPWQVLGTPNTTVDKERSMLSHRSSLGGFTKKKSTTLPLKQSRLRQFTTSRDTTTNHKKKNTINSTWVTSSFGETVESETKEEEENTNGTTNSIPESPVSVVVDENEEVNENVRSGGGGGGSKTEKTTRLSLWGTGDATRRKGGGAFGDNDTYSSLEQQSRVTTNDTTAMTTSSTTNNQQQQQQQQQQGGWEVK